MGPIWGRQDPGGPHVGPMNFAIWEAPFVSVIALRTNKLQLESRESIRVCYVSIRINGYAHVG